MSFESEPEGVTVRVDGKVIGDTPVSVRLDKADDQTLTFELEGYKTVTKDFLTGVDPWFFGNILIGGLFGSTTDFASGAVYEYKPDQYFVTLPAEEGSDGGLAPRQKVERFIVANYSQLRFAASKPSPGEDEVFGSLMKLVTVHSANDRAIKALADTLLQSEDAAQAADSVADEYSL